MHELLPATEAFKNNIRTAMVFLFAIILVASVELPGFADTFKLTDGTILVCKIIKETESTYVVANAYGTFTIKKRNVTALHVTSSYQDDLKILKQMGVKTDEATVKKNFEEGIKKKEIEQAEVREGRCGETGTRPGCWNFARIGTYASYLNSAISDLTAHRGLNAKIPHGLGFQIAYDQGLDAVLGYRQAGLPGLRIEAGYLGFGRSFFNTSAMRITGFAAQAGLMWAVPSLTGARGCFVAAILPGAGYFEAVNEPMASRNRTYHFVFTALAGYEYMINRVALCIHVRYTYIQDNSVPVHGIGVSVGLATGLW